MTFVSAGFNLCGFKFGYTAILGLIPIAGDAVAAYLNYKLVLTKCMEVEGGLPSEVLARMTFSKLFDRLLYRNHILSFRFEQTTWFPQESVSFH